MIFPAVSQCLKQMCFPGTQIEFLTEVILETISMLTAASEVEEATHTITRSSLSCGVCHIELMPGVFTAGNIAQQSGVCYSIACFLGDSRQHQLTNLLVPVSSSLKQGLNNIPSERRCLASDRALQCFPNGLPSPASVTGAFSLILGSMMEELGLGFSYAQQAFSHSAASLSLICSQTFKTESSKVAQADLMLPRAGN